MRDTETKPAPACSSCVNEGQTPAPATKTVYRVENMDCPTEEGLIRDKLSKIDGVQSLEFNLMQRTLAVLHTLPSLQPIEKALVAIGMKAQLMIANGNAEAASQSLRYRIDNMDCPTEESLIRDKLSRIEGIAALEFNLLQRTLALSHTLPSAEPIEKALAEIGMKAERLTVLPWVTKTVLSISKMDCPTEESLIRSKLEAMPGITAMSFNLMQRRLTLEHEPATLKAALDVLNDIGLPAELVEERRTPAQSLPQQRMNWWPMAISGVSATAAEIVEWSVGGFHWATVGLALLAIFTGGLPTYKKGWIALRNGNLNMNSLMTIAVTGAMIIGHWPEAAMVMFLFALAEVIEALSLDRARRAIRNLMDLAPERATVQQPDGSWAEIDAKQVAVNALVRARPGERIAMDGIVLSGNSTVNQAPITGESLPIEKAPGDPVFAGTVNQAGSFEYRVTALADDSTLARIIHAVEAAQGTRAPTQRFVDRFARVYTPTVFAVALAVALVPPLLMGGLWLDWIYRALVLLVIACPCALVISTPVTIVSGLAAAARKGILIKGGAYLENGRRLSVLALDKTGTVTHGKPAQTDFGTTADHEGTIVRRLAASLAARSDHPVSTALAKAASDAGISPKEVEEFKALPGRGVQGRIDDQLFYLGNHRLIAELGLSSAQWEEKRNAFERQGKTVVFLIDESKVLGFFAVADTVRNTSREAIAELHGLGVRTVLLTGDNAFTAAAIAQQVGIDEARGDLLPEDKLRVVEQLGSGNRKVGMVGDGINDAPALAKADIGFAMGAAGTDTAIETADVALMDDDLRKVPSFVRLSRTTAAILKQNIVLALGIKGVFIVLTFAGIATMWMAVFADMGASLLVVFNGLRLLRS